jgi:mannose-6-phosphate isomerase-like protein (cupin superfamily)
LNEENLIDRLIARFSSLLTWQDEDFVVVSGTKISQVDDRKKLVLKSDLVGVPSKVPYIWNSGDKLF